MSDNAYDRTIDEQLEEMEVVCGTHGELSNDELGVSSDGRIICGFCIINQEMDVRNEMDIDASVDVRWVVSDE